MTEVDCTLLSSDGARLFYADSVAGQIRGVQVDGGPAETFASASNVSGLVVAGDRVFWSSFSGVMSAPSAGGAPTLIAHTGSYPFGLVVDDANAYWLEGAIWDNTEPYGGSVRRASLAGVDDVTTLAGGFDAPDGIAIEGSSVFVTSRGNGKNGRVSRVSLAGGETTTLADALDLPWMTTTDGSFVYFGGEAGLMLVPVQGGPLGVAAPMLSVGSLAIYDGFVYATVGAYGDPSAEGAVVRVPLGGGVPVPLATGLHEPLGIAVDATSVYWSTVQDRAITRLAPR